MRRRYGASPLHALAHLLALLLVGYAVFQVLALDDSLGILLWLAAAVLLHDAVLWPLYASADRAGGRALGAAANHVRVPLGLSLVLALAFLSTLSGRGESTYGRASGQAWDGHLARWLIVTAALFGISGLVWLLRARRR